VKRKNLLMILLLLLSSMVLVSCGSESSKPLRICFDIGSILDDADGSSLQESVVQGFVDDIKLYAKQYDGPEEIEVEVIPSSRDMATERAAMLQRIRTEIMTGSGPDVFIVRCEGHGMYQIESTRLFPYPQKAIEGDFFLPLDKMLPSMQFTVWEDLHSNIMNGGRNQRDEQVVFPMTFAVPINIFHKEDLPQLESNDFTWHDVVALEDPAQAELVRWMWMENLPVDIHETLGHDSGLPYLFNQVANYDSGILLFTEDDIYKEIKNALAAYQELMTKKSGLMNYSVLPWYTRISDFPQGTPFGSSHETTDLTMLPLKTLNGGVVAEIDMYCAINRNTENAEEALFVIDLLMSEGYQQSSGFYRGGVMPTNKNLCAPGKKYHNEAPFYLEFTEQQYEEWLNICNQVTAVHYRSPLETEMEDMIMEIQQTMADSYEQDPEKKWADRVRDFYYGEITDEQLREIIHRHYKRMCRLIDES